MADKKKDRKCSRCGEMVDLTISLQAHDQEKETRQVCMKCFKHITNQLIEKVRRA